MDYTYIDLPTFSLGDINQSIEKANESDLLFSDIELLKEAGFNSHYLCSASQRSYDLAVDVVSKIEKKMNTSIKNIDAIIYSTCFPINANLGLYKDFIDTKDVKHLLNYPGSQLQAKFEMNNAIVVGIDQQACTSMLGAIRLADMYLKCEPNFQEVLCLTADRFPEGAKYEQTYNLISDGAAAIIATKEKKGFKVLACHQITNGAMAEANDDETVGFYFNYTHRLITEGLKKCNLNIQEINYIIPQNTNIKAWNILSSLLQFSMDKILMNGISKIGHCISGDNIINLKLAIDNGTIKSKDKIIMIMAGYGLNWQMVILEKV